jgi:hypothetical protein
MRHRVWQAASGAGPLPSTLYDLGNIFIRILAYSLELNLIAHRVPDLLSSGRSIRMVVPRILSVGSDHTLMASRTLVLRLAGYAVEEAYSVDKAIILVEADSIDVTLICHTIPKREQHLLIAVIRKKRRLMPVVCIRSFACESAPQSCIAVDNDPTILLDCVKLAVQPPILMADELAGKQKLIQCPACDGMIPVMAMEHRFAARYTCPHCDREVLLTDDTRPN